MISRRPFERHNRGRVPSGGVLVGFDAYSAVLGAGLVQYCDTDVGVTIATGVSAWLDRVNSGNSYAQGDPNRQPAYSASGGPNNAPYMSFVSSGTADVLVSTLTRPAPGTQGTYVRAVMRLDAWAANATLWSSNSAVNVMMCQAFNATPIVRQFNTTPGNQNNGFTAVGVWKVLEAWFSNSVADEIRIGSVVVTGINSGNSSGTGRILGATSPTGINPSDYSLVRIAYASALPSAGQRTALDAIDAARYGATIIT